MNQDWREALRAKGYRLTPQRELVLAAVEKLGHATPEELLAEVRTSSSAVNLSTIYRNLEVLEGLGLVRHAHFSDRTSTYHSTSEHEHFHLICRKCRKVISVDTDVAGPFAELLRTTYAFEPDLGHLTVFGACVTCEPDTQSDTQPDPQEDGDERPDEHTHE